MRFREQAVEETTRKLKITCFLRSFEKRSSKICYLDDHPLFLLRYTLLPRSKAIKRRGPRLYTVRSLLYLFVFWWCGLLFFLPRHYQLGSAKTWDGSCRERWVTSLLFGCEHNFLLHSLGLWLCMICLVKRCRVSGPIPHPQPNPTHPPINKESKTSGKTKIDRFCCCGCWKILKSRRAVDGEPEGEKPQSIGLPLSAWIFRTWLIVCSMDVIKSKFLFRKWDRD